MPRTIEHIVETHRLAQERRSAGKPIWAHKLTAPRREDDFEWNRDRFAEALRKSSWFRAHTAQVDHEWQSELWQLWHEIKDADDVDHFDAVLDAIYDLADYERCAISFVHE